MIRFTAALLAVLVCAVATTGCDPSPPVMGIDDDGGSVSVGVGEELTLVLPGNPSTGYAWTVTEGDPTVLRQLGDPEFRPESSLAGAPGDLRISFQAMEPGETRLELEYARPFETEPPLDVFALDVTVR